MDKFSPFTGKPQIILYFLNICWSKASEKSQSMFSTPSLFLYAYTSFLSPLSFCLCLCLYPSISSYLSICVSLCRNSFGNFLLKGNATVRITLYVVLELHHETQFLNYLRGFVHCVLENIVSPSEA